MPDVAKTAALNLKFSRNNVRGRALFFFLSAALLTFNACGLFRSSTKRIPIDRHLKPSASFAAPVKPLHFLSPFGPRKNRYHTGVDIRGKRGGGDKVYASRSGKVMKAEKGRGYGKMVVIKHADGFRSRYAHLKKFLVRTGESVKTGTPIGIVGKSGRATHPHLHFEILTPKGYFTDPWPLIK